MHKIFESNPSLKKAYVTSDGTPFYQENDAKNHAKNLKDKTIEPVFNEKELQVVEEEELSQEEKDMATFEQEEKEKAEQAQKEAEESAAKAELAAELAEFDPEVTKYPEALKLFKALGLEAENEQKVTIYPLLAAAKANAQEGANTQV